MNRKTSSFNAVVAISMALLSLLVAGFLFYSWSQLREENRKENQALLALRSAKLVGTLGANVVLPENKPLTVCNPSSESVNIVAIAATYRTADGNLETFNSTHAGRHSWLIPPRSRESLTLFESGKTLWDGSVIFYTLDTRSKGKDYLLSGTADQLEGGCLSLTVN